MDRREGGSGDRKGSCWDEAKDWRISSWIEGIGQSNSLTQWPNQGVVPLKRVIALIPLHHLWRLSSYLQIHVQVRPQQGDANHICAKGDYFGGGGGGEEWKLFEDEFSGTRRDKGIFLQAEWGSETTGYG